MIADILHNNIGTTREVMTLQKKPTQGTNNKIYPATQFSLSLRTPTN